MYQGASCGFLSNLNILSCGCSTGEHLVTSGKHLMLATSGLVQKPHDHVSATKVRVSWSWSLGSLDMTHRLPWKTWAAGGASGPPRCLFVSGVQWQELRHAGHHVTRADCHVDMSRVSLSVTWRFDVAATTSGLPVVSGVCWSSHFLTTCFTWQHHRCYGYPSLSWLRVVIMTTRSWYSDSTLPWWHIEYLHCISLYKQTGGPRPRRDLYLCDGIKSNLSGMYVCLFPCLSVCQFPLISVIFVRASSWDH